MDNIKKIIGLLCIAVGVLAEYYLITAITSGSLVKNPEENKIFALTVIPVSIPVLLGGLVLFGYYALKGEYSEANKS
jgi:ABC-type transport system involved in cytochrome c biogenesis permease component